MSWDDVCADRAADGRYDAGDAAKITVGFRPDPGWGNTGVFVDIPCFRVLPEKPLFRYFLVDSRNNVFMLIVPDAAGRRRKKTS